MSGAAELLLRARLDRAPLGGLPDDCRPADAAAAYAIQAANTRALMAALEARPIGYKIGATGAAARKLLGTETPFYGRLFDRLTRASPARLASAETRVRVIEAEFAFRLARDLPAAGGPWTRESVAGAVAACLPAIEVVDSRFAEWTKVGVLSVIADQGSHGHWIRGPERADWQGLDLAGHPVRLRVNGETLREGMGRNVLDHPLNALAWLANELNAQGSMLAAGDCVSTGTATDVYPARPGDRLTADFGSLGTVELEIGRD